MNLIPTQDGAFTFKYQDKFVHSSRSPLREAGKLIADIHNYDPLSTLVIAWGTGLGYHIDLLIKKHHIIYYMVFFIVFIL